MVVDIRSIPRSRTNPQYNQDTLPETLAGFQVGYERIAELGGLRSKTKHTSTAVNDFWQNNSFRNYADYALTAPFREGLNTLIALGREQRCAIMCAEAVWWRCHRRLVADYLLAGGESIFHLMGNDTIQPAKLTVGAHVSQDGVVTYPAVTRPE